jgi:hypothetical protein
VRFFLSLARFTSAPFHQLVWMHRSQGSAYSPRKLFLHRLWIAEYERQMLSFVIPKPNAMKHLVSLSERKKKLAGR